MLGTNFGPRSPGTVLTLLYRLAAEAAGGGALSQPQGGLGALCDALAGAASAAGAVIRTGAPVARILVEADRAAGVVLESGERIAAGAVISSADPKTTFLQLLGPRYLDTGFVRRVDHLRARGLAAKLHLALDRAPQFAGLSAAALGGRLLLAPSLQYIERAYNHAKYGEYSSAPAMEITVPTINDPLLAPAGKHVISAIVQYAPYALRGGWLTQRERFTELCIETLETYAPGLRSSIVSAELLTPRGHRAGVSHQRRSLAPRRTRVRPILHGAPGAGRRATSHSAAGSVSVRRRLPSGRRRHGHRRSQRGAADSAGSLNEHAADRCRRTSASRC